MLFHSKRLRCLVYLYFCSSSLEVFFYSLLNTRYFKTFIWPIDRTLIGTNKMCQSGAKTNVAEGVLHIPLISITGISTSDADYSYFFDILSWTSVTPLQWIQSVYSELHRFSKRERELLRYIVFFFFWKCVLSCNLGQHGYLDRN